MHQHHPHRPHRDGTADQNFRDALADTDRPFAAGDDADDAPLRMAVPAPRRGVAMSFPRSPPES